MKYRCRETMSKFHRAKFYSVSMFVFFSKEHTRFNIILLYSIYTLCFENLFFFEKVYIYQMNELLTDCKKISKLNITLLKNNKLRSNDYIFIEMEKNIEME